MISPRRRAQLGLIASAFVLVFALSIIVNGAFEKPNRRAGMPGAPAIAFRLPDLSGKIVSLSSLRGSVVVLCFAPDPDKALSDRDVQRVAELGRQYAADPSVKLLTIYNDSDGGVSDQQRLVRQRVEDTGINCVALLDPTSGVSKRYGIEETPTFLIIDPSGMIRYRGGIDDVSPDAPLSAVSFSTMIDLLLAEKPLPGQSAPAVLSNISK